jgi:hypothetical protein
MNTYFRTHVCAKCVPHFASQERIEITESTGNALRARARKSQLLPTRCVRLPVYLPGGLMRSATCPVRPLYVNVNLNIAGLGAKGYNRNH